MKSIIYLCALICISIITSCINLKTGKYYCRKYEYSKIENLDIMYLDTFLVIEICEGTFLPEDSRPFYDVYSYFLLVSMSSKDTVQTLKKVVSVNKDEIKKVDKGKKIIMKSIRQWNGERSLCIQCYKRSELPPYFNKGFPTFLCEEFEIIELSP